MTPAKQQAAAIIDIQQLKCRIEDLLRVQRHALGEVSVDRVWFEDAAWRVTIMPRNGWPDGYTDVLADVEETLFDESGVNVMLTPAAPSN